MKDFCCGARVGKWQIVQKYSGSPTRARVANDFRQAQIVSWDSPGDQRRRMKFYQSCHLSDHGATFTTKSARCGVAASRSDYCADISCDNGCSPTFGTMWFSSRTFTGPSCGTRCRRTLRERLREAVGKPQREVDARTSVSKKEARGAYEEILQVVEQLYAENGL